MTDDPAVTAEPRAHDHRSELRTVAGKAAYEAVREVVYYGVKDRFPATMDLVSYVGDRLLELEDAVRAEAARDVPEGLDVDRLVTALRAVDERIAREYPDEAVDMLSDEAETGRRDYAAALAAEYAALAASPKGPHTPHDPPDYVRAAAEAVVGAWYAGTGPPTEAQVRGRAIAVAHLAAVLQDSPKGLTPEPAVPLGQPCIQHQRQGFIYTVIGCPQCYPVPAALPDPEEGLDAAWPDRAWLISHWVGHRCGFVACRTTEPHEHGGGQAMQESKP